MPASRRARAMIFAPRSWPSRPGLATTTRILPCVGEVAGLIDGHTLCAATAPRRAPAAAGLRMRAGAALAHQAPERGERRARPERREHLQTAPETIQVQHLPAFLA